PNVGKSTFVKKASSASPEIADYPFTTKKIKIGHFEDEGEKIQIIDTPGLLERPIDEKNKIELQSILALKYLADAVIFLFDPSETCGYPISNQLALFEQIRKLLSDIVIFPIINKVDVSPDDVVEKLEKQIGETLKINSNNEDDVKKVISTLFKKIRSKI
ncbi:MAG: GTPase, partial [Candidatus Odinarchaeia archaeon]